MNHVVLFGHLSSEPQMRTLASGSVVWSLEVTTPTDDGAWSVPVAWFDPPYDPPSAPGDQVVVLGAVRRRFFRGAAGTQSRTEVVATAVIPRSATRRWQRKVRREIERLGAMANGEVRST